MKFESLKDKVVMITGGAGGFGERMAYDYAVQGCKIVIVDTSLEAGEELAKKISKEFNVEAFAVQADIGSNDQVKDMAGKVIDRFGTVHVLVNNAAVGWGNPIDSYNDDEWYKTLDVNVTGAYFCIKYVLGCMKDQKWGRIINISSIQGKFGFPYTGAYAVSKHGIIGLGRVTAAEVAKFGITVNTVCPGFSEGAGQKRQTASLKRDEEYTGVTAEEQRLQILDAIPLTRRVTPEEISNMVIFLSSGEASGITGQDISVDGGMIQLHNIPRPPR